MSNESNNELRVMEIKEDMDNDKEGSMKWHESWPGEGNNPQRMEGAVAVSLGQVQGGHQDPLGNNEYK